MEGGRRRDRKQEERTLVWVSQQRFTTARSSAFILKKEHRGTGSNTRTVLSDLRPFVSRHVGFIGGIPPDHQKNLKYLINSGFECDYNKTGSDTQTQAEDMRHRKVILYHKHRFSLLCDSAAVIAPVYLPDGRRAAENVLLSGIFPGDGQ